MNLNEPHNKNYCATIVELNNFVELANCDNVKAAIIFGNSVIVGKDVEPGTLGVFFPVETQLNAKFLGANNLFRKFEFGNIDLDSKGFFEQHGRIKAMKFRGHKSEGFWLPLQALNNWSGVDINQFQAGMEFDAIDGVELCQKYIPKTNRVPGIPQVKGKQPKLEDKIVPGQFRLHYDTAQLGRNIHKLNPSDIISISDKWHGTSAVFANILVNRNLNWYEKLLRKLGVKIEDTEYGITWSSRQVIKGVNGKTKSTNFHFYGTDVWGSVAAKIQDCIPKGFTIYGEIVGYTETNSMIQKGYHYGCEVGTNKFMVYRVTSTNADGQPLELAWGQMKEFCNKFGLTHVPELYYGTADNLCAKLPDESDEAWQTAFVRRLERTFVYDQMCPHNNNEVPAEGIVLRIDHLNESEAYKMKNFKFRERETKQLDSGEIDLETEQSSEEVA
jgi:RNA ligase-like protein